MKVFLLGLGLLTFVACSSEATEEVIETTEAVLETSTISEEDLVIEMQSLHESLRKTKDGSLNKSNAESLLSQAADFVTNHPESENRLQVLKYAEASSRGLGNLNEALRFLNIILNENPEIEKRDQLLSLKAHTFAELERFEEAKEVYQEIIDNYPDSDWAEDAKGNLMTVGKSDEELLEFLKLSN